MDGEDETSTCEYHMEAAGLELADNDNDNDDVYEPDTWMEFGCPDDLWEAYGLTACWRRRKWDEQGELAGCKGYFS